MKKPAIIPLSSKSNVALVVEQLENLIQDGCWQEDERILPEIELCKRFNVGRSTIREALNTLKARNRIYTIPGLGSFVSKAENPDSNFILTHIPNPKSGADLINIIEVRLSLEPMNAAFAARRATEEHIHKMSVFQDALTSPTSANPAIFAENDLAFHILVAEATGNPVVMDVMNMARSFLMAQQVVTSQQTSRRTKAAKYHQRILEAIIALDDLQAEAVMREHMEDTYLYVKSLLTQSKHQSGRPRPRNDKPISL